MLNFIVVVLFFPETRYYRSGVRTIAPDEGPASSDTRSEALSDIEIARKDSEKSHGLAASEISDRSGAQEMIPKKSWRQELTLWSGVPKDTSLLKLFIRPLPLIVYPAVIVSFLGYAVSLSWVVAINILNPFVLQAPPYNWKPSINGLINITGLIGNVIGAWLGGWVVDKYSDWRSKKNGGIFEPETRLHLMIIPALIVPAGCLAFGYGVAEQLNWTALWVAKQQNSVQLEGRLTKV